MASFDKNDYGYYPISYTNNTEWGAEPPFGTPVTEVILGHEENPNVKNPSYNPNGAYNKIYGSAARWNQRANPNPIDPSLDSIMGREPQYQPTTDDYENQMRLENGAVSQYNNSYGHALNDILAQVFDGNVAYANPAPSPQVSEKSPKGFGRPYVMSLQEYQDNYLPYYGLNYEDIPKEELPQQFNRMSNPDRDY